MSFGALAWLFLVLSVGGMLSVAFLSETKIAVGTPCEALIPWRLIKFTA